MAPTQQEEEREADPEDRKAIRVRPGAKHGEVGINRLLARLRHVFSWAITEGYVTDTPFKRHGVTVVKLETRVETARTRRLQPGTTSKPGEAPTPGEEERLLQHAGPHLRALIVAAFSTGCRVGGLLSLQQSQIRCDEQGEARWIELPAERTKTNQARVIPIGSRLRAELAMRRHAPDGREHPPDAYVFGNECGERIEFPDVTWMTTVLRTHGIAPVWDNKRKTLSAESRTAYRRIDLHFHDLRREFASRLLESGASEHDVAAFLGHANITTTSRHLATTPVRLEKALQRLEEHVGSSVEARQKSAEAAEEPTATQVPTH